MASTVYGFRPGRSLKNVDPQEVGNELERIRSTKGTLVAPDVLDAARDPSSPMHAAFEWDDSVAAEQHRLTQARRLIVSVRVINSPTNGARVPAWVSVRTAAKGREYVPVVEAMSDEQLSARVLAEVQTFLESIERRYGAFKEVQGILANLRKAAG